MMRRSRFSLLIVTVLTLSLLGVAKAQEAEQTLIPEAEQTPETTQIPTFDIGNELTVAALRELEIEGSDILLEQTLANGYNYSQYIASYTSDGNKIYGLLTIPFGDPPEGGFKAIVFNHGYIPPSTYVTTERYVAYVNALASNGFVVFKIDMRGHGDSEGESQGSYFSPGYTIDAISALKSLQRMSVIDPEGIGMWGHSMAGNLTLRAMLMEPDVKAGVIWGGAVYSYDDLTQYAISDPSFSPSAAQTTGTRRMGQVLRETYGQPNTIEPYWQAVSLTKNIQYLEAPLQLHHAVNDDVVNIGYSRDLSRILTENGKFHEFYEYDGGGHNISSPYFEDAMLRTILFFQTYL